MDIDGIGRRVRERRRALGMTQDALGELVGRDKMGISRIEGGTIRLRIEELGEFADALAVHYRWLVGEEDAPEPMPAEAIKVMREAEALKPEHLAIVRDRLSRLPRRPQARCAARLGEGDITRRRMSA